MVVFRVIAFLLSLYVVSSAQAAVITVGPGASAGLPTRDHTDVCAAIAASTSTTGTEPDRIDIDGADSGGNQITYWNLNCQYAKSVYLKGVGAKRPVFNKTADFVVGGLHGYLRPSDGHQTLENIEARGARCGANCTVIWPESVNVDSFTLTNVWFDDNDDNFITQNQVMASNLRTVMVTITSSEFSRGGIWDGAAQAHCIYVGEVHTLTFRNNYVHDCHNGQGLKSRAGVNYVVNNRFRDRRSSGYSTSSTTNLELDFPNGGLIHFVGNIIEQGENTPPSGLSNGNAHVMSVAGEKAARDTAGAENVLQELYVTYNTFTSRRSGAIFVRDNNSGTTRTIKNNIFAGASATVFWVGNPGSAQADPADNSVFSSIAAANFTNGTGFDLRLGASSTALNAAVTIGSIGTSPYEFTHETGKQYAHPRTEITRTVQGGTLDRGALERGIDGTAYIEPPYTEVSNSSGKVTVFWGQSLHENNAPTGYSVYRNGTLLTTTAANVESYEDTSGTAGAEYYYTVLAKGSPDSALSNSALAGSQRAAATTIGNEAGWHYLSNTNFATNVCTPSGNCSTYWAGHIAGAAWDNTDRRLFVFGGDWAQRDKNAIYAFYASTPAWSKLNADDTVTSNEYASSRPRQRYTYGGVAWSDPFNLLILYGGYTPGPAYSTRTWEWTLATDVWSDVASGFDLSLDIGSTAARANGKIWVQSQDTNLREYDPEANTYAIVKTGVSGVSYTRYLVAAESINRLFMVGQGHLSYFNLASSYAQTTVTHTTCEIQNIAAYPAVAFNSDTGKLIIWNKGTSVMTFDPNSGTCSKQVFVGEPNLGTGMPSNGFVYDSTAKGFWALSPSANMAFLRLEAYSPTTRTRLKGRRGRSKKFLPFS